jgi:two-component system response regulator HydG
VTDAGHLLLVDDDQAALTLLSEVLERDAYDVETALSVDEAIGKLQRAGPFDAVVTDLRMPVASGLDLVSYVREHDPHAVLLVLTAFGDATATAEAIRAGAYDLINKPFDIDTLRATIARAIERRRMAIVHRLEEAPATPQAAGGAGEPPLIVGHSPGIIAAVKTLARVARTDATVLLEGESGTGKELAARTLHHYSNRAARHLVVVNCGALPETLLESELFGHVKGAFTGASTSRPGLFREADRGTLFLDEIGDLSLHLQTRLLRALQEREVVPVGAETPIKVDVRVVAATHRDLSAMVKDGDFREDLFYRLDVVTVQLPPLRARKQDVPLLVDHFLRTLGRRHRRGPVAVDPDAQARLLAYDWPGNVRQLQNVLERALVLAEQDVIGPEHLPEEIRLASTTTRASSAPDAAAQGDGPTLAAVERRHVLRVLDETGGNRQAAAKALGISRRTLLRMLHRWGMVPPKE